MGIIDRFFGKKSSAAAGAGDQSAATTTAKDRAIGLQVLFTLPPLLDAATLTGALRSYDPEMARATCEIDAETARNGTPVGLVTWGPHVIRLVGFDAPMPQAALERCVQPAHYPASLKAAAREHGAHVLLYYGGEERDPVERYVALAAVAGVIAGEHGVVVANESARTSFPAAALARNENVDMLALLRSLPLPILYSGLVKYDVEGVSGTWMRTYGNELLGLPDFSLHTAGHHEGEKTMNLFDGVMSYLLSSGATLAPGHTMELGGINMRARSPTASEPFLESAGQMLVLEEIDAREVRR